MSRVNDKPGARLVAVERLRDMELELARVEHVAANDLLARQREMAEQIQSRLDEAQGLALDHMQSAAGVSADELRRTGSYARWQAQALSEQRQRVREAEHSAKQALAEVARRHQALTVIEKLRERHARDAAFEAARAEQKALDDHALLRVAPQGSGNREQQQEGTSWP